MSSFRDRPFDQRIGAMGDQAEGVFEQVYPQGWVRFGLNRPPLAMHMLPRKIRFTPDYLTSKGFVEVQGFGRDQTFKLKDDKLDALWDWHRDFRCDLFVYDSANHRYGFVRLADLCEAFDANGMHGAFDGGANPYQSLIADFLPVTDGWKDAP